MLPSDVKEKAQHAKLSQNKTDDEWLSGVVPSFLNVDYQGRVIRIDTFSKVIHAMFGVSCGGGELNTLSQTVGPGTRLGYFTSSPSLLRILQFINESTTQAPSGLSQAIVGQLLHEYKEDGFTRWLRGLAAQYELRRAPPDFTQVLKLNQSHRFR